MAFSDRLAAAVDRVGSPTCVGLDPVLERLPTDVAGVEPADRICAFCGEVIDALAGVVAFVKPQSACFERYGAPGIEALEAVCAHARDAGMLVILDVKRADIGVTASHYAAGAVGAGAHAVTLSPYMGPSSIEPFLDLNLGAFVLVRTSNPDAGTFQDAPLALGDGASAGDDRTISERVARLVDELGDRRLGLRGISSVGAVVGVAGDQDAESRSRLERLRVRMPHAPILVPGVGAQGGRVADVEPLLADRNIPGRGVIINASRSILYPDINLDWRSAIRTQARMMVDEVRSLVD